MTCEARCNSPVISPVVSSFVLCWLLVGFGLAARAEQAELVCPPLEQKLNPRQEMPYLSLLEMNAEQRQRLRSPTIKIGQSMDAAQVSAGFMELARRGSLLLDLGRLDEGLAFLLEAQPLQASASAEERIEFLNDLGRAFAGTAQFGKARELFAQAALLAQQERQALSAIRSSINGLRAQIDDQDLGGLRQRLKTSTDDVNRLPASPGRASMQVALGDVFLRAVTELGFGDEVLATAQGLFQAAIRQAGDKETLGYAHGFLGRLKEAQGQNAAALDSTNTALRYAQETDSLAQVYRWEWQAAGLLREAGESALALEALQRAVFLLDEYSDAVIPKSPRAFASLVVPVYTEYADLLLEQAAGEASATGQQEQLRSARRLVESLKHAEVEDYFASRCLEPAVGSMDMQSAGSAIIYPVLFNSRLELLVEIDDKLHQFTVPVQRTEFERAVRKFRINLERPRSGKDYRAEAQQLYRWMITPLLGELTKASVHTLVIVPDGALRTIPLAALHDGNQFLIEQYALATTPAIQLTHTAAAGGDMRFLAGGLTQGVQGFSELPNVAKEIDELAGQFPVRELRDERFVTSAVAKGLASTDFSLVHLATHGEFKADYKKSFLLTFDDRLTLGGLQSILRTRAGAPLDLLVLSACQTAAGDDRAALGLAGVAVQSGARSALASLWSISDASTAELFAIFYQQLRSEGNSKAHSLRQAQRALLQQPEYQHPSYWAPFLLIGDWT